jgi:signal transduction histidine kinase
VDELSELRASRRRIVLADDADRRTLERALHTGVQQLLVALSVRVQLARRQAAASPDDVEMLFDEIEDEVRVALDEAARLADRISPPLLETGGLGAALRAAIVYRSIPATMDVDLDHSCSPAITRAVYICCLELLERSTGAATATVRKIGDALAFEIAAEDILEAGIERARDRVESFGGRLTLEAGSGRIAVSGSLPLSE